MLLETEELVMGGYLSIPPPAVFSKLSRRTLAHPFCFHRALTQLQHRHTGVSCRACTVCRKLMASVCFQSQAKSIAEQKRFPFATDNDSTNEELGENLGWEHPITPSQIRGSTL